MASMAAVAMMVECGGGCGVLVRPENVNCDKCVDIARMLVARRLRDARDRSFGVGEYARRDVGTVDHRRGDPCRLDDAPLTLRERVACGLMSAGALATVAWGGWLGYLFLRWAL